MTSAAMLASEPERIVTSAGQVRVCTLAQVEADPRWADAFRSNRKDSRYYAIVERTILQGFEYLYFVVDLPDGHRAFQPFFLLPQDLLAGSGQFVQKWAARIRRIIPNALTLRTLMVGCAAGEGHLDEGDPAQRAAVAKALSEAARVYARKRRHRMLVFKEFLSTYRQPLAPLRTSGFTRVPSLPMTRLNIDYPDFDTYVAKALSKVTRKNIRRKLRDAEEAHGSSPITMEVVQDISPYVNEALALYLQVYNRSKLHFEKLTSNFLIELGRQMPDKARFFIWRRDGRMIAMSVCLINADAIYDEYLGLDYSVALDLHLYFYTLRDIIQWAIAHGCKWYVSSALNYDPKLHLKSNLEPLDLYVHHTWPILNFFLGRLLPLLEPTRNDPTLAKFANYKDLWGDARGEEARDKA